MLADKDEKQPDYQLERILAKLKRNDSETSVTPAAGTTLMPFPVRMIQAERERKKKRGRPRPPTGETGGMKAVLREREGERIKL